MELLIYQKKDLKKNYLSFLKTFIDSLDVQNKNITNSISIALLSLFAIQNEIYKNVDDIKFFDRLFLEKKTKIPSSFFKQISKDEVLKFSILKDLVAFYDLYRLFIVNYDELYVDQYVGHLLDYKDKHYPHFHDINLLWDDEGCSLSDEDIEKLDNYTDTVHNVQSLPKFILDFMETYKIDEKQFFAIQEFDKLLKDYLFDDEIIDKDFVTLLENKSFKIKNQDIPLEALYYSGNISSGISSEDFVQIFINGYTSLNKLFDIGSTALSLLKKASPATLAVVGVSAVFSGIKKLSENDKLNKSVKKLSFLFNQKSLYTKTCSFLLEYVTCSDKLVDMLEVTYEYEKALKYEADIFFALGILEYQSSFLKRAILFLKIPDELNLEKLNKLTNSDDLISARELVLKLYKKNDKGKWLYNDEDYDVENHELEKIVSVFESIGYFSMTGVTKSIL